MSENIRARLLGNFKESTDMNVLNIQRLLVDLESQPDNPNLLKEVFRMAHTIKGDARMMGMPKITSVAHEAESILMEMRDGRLKLQPEITDLLFEATEAINVLAESEVRGTPVTMDIVELNGRLNAVINPPAPAEASETASPASTDNHKVALAEEKATPAEATQPNQPVLRQVNALNAPSIQVNVAKLDELMNIAGELVLGKMEAESTLSSLRALQDLLRQRQRVSGPVRNLIASQGRDPSEVTTWQEIRDALVQVNQIDQQIDLTVRNTLRDYEEHTSQLVNRVDELESNVKSVRMLPIETIYQDLPPAVRQLARQNERDMPDYRQIGGEIELDKKVLEAIHDPIRHILGNALYHGIEKPADRENAGKPRMGRLTVITAQDGGYVSIKVTDDGAGIDPDKIRETAIRKNFLTEARARMMSDEDVINLIYEPGFSTASIITDGAGRGVGMDVAKTNLEKLGGQVNVTSRIGHGTTVTMRMPVTLATSRALLVRVSGSVYALLAPSIESMHYLTPDKILSREGRDVMLYGDTLLPLVKMQDLITGNQHQHHPIFRYQTMHNDRAELVGTGLAVKLTNGDGNTGGYAQSNGAANLEAVMGEGFVGLTLADPRAKLRIRELQDQSQERRVRQFTFERLPAVVVGSGDRRVCFLVDELVDETEIVVKSLSPLLARAPHVNSATIMGDGQVVMILDVPSLVNSARQITRTGLRKQRDRNSRRKRILVVDDSITTRELERSILEAHGYTVELADDGTVAVEMLSKDNHYDLVISDVEMPNMNGFELTANIKGNSATREIPVIIVTSLNNEDHKRQGIDAGAQAYMTKGDFEQANLLSTIEYLTDWRTGTERSGGSEQE